MKIKAKTRFRVDVERDDSGGLVNFKRQHSSWFNGLLIKGSMAFAFSATSAQANPFQLPENAIRSPRDLDGQDELNFHPFQKKKSGLELTFGREGLGAVTLDRDFARFMRDRMDPRLGLTARTLKPLSLVGAPEESRDYSFSLAGIPVCDHQVKVQWVQGVGPIVLGTMPRLNADATISSVDWPARADAFEKIAEHASLNGIVDDLTDVEASMCWWSERGEVYPAWKLTVNGGEGLSYASIASADEVFQFLPRHIHAQGVAKIYPRNSTDDTLQEFTLNDLKGTTFLESEYFYTVLDSSSTNTRATKADHRFIYSPGTSEFDETSIFTNATRTLQWYFDLGYDAFGGNRIALKVHAVMAQGGANNAQYTPAVSGDDPTIYVGDGDGDILENMATDTDVVSHEFGHHVVYESITAIEGESLVLHEGLADFFAFSRTNDPCLGESICPANNRIGCVTYQSNKCLRLAKNDYTMASAPPEAHLKSQFISGFLWDLRDVDGIPSADLSKLVLNVVGRLLAKSKYEHLILAMLIADRSAYEGQYCDVILARAKTRGLDSRINTLSCEGDLPELNEGTTTATSVPGSSSSSSSRGSGGGFCGVVGHGGAAPWWTLLTLLAPIGLGFLRTKTRSRD